MYIFILSCIHNNIYYVHVYIMYDNFTGEIEVTTDNVQDLLPAAGILQLRDLKTACCEFLSDHMDVTNCLGIKQFADMHSCPGLVKKANRFIVRKFADVVKTDEFLDVPHHVLCELLENDHLHVENELQVFTAFLRWMDHDIDGRAPFAYDLLGCIRIPLLPKQHWEAVFRNHRLFKVGVVFIESEAIVLKLLSILYDNNYYYYCLCIL